MIQTILIRLLGVLLVTGVLGTVYKYIQHSGVQQCEAKQTAQSAKLILEYQQRLAKAEEQRDANQIIIDNLLAHARSVQLRIPICPNIVGSKDQDGAARILSQRVDESFARFQERTGQLFKRCDELNLDAIKANHAQK